MKLVDAEQLFCCDCEYKERCKNVTCDVKTMPTISAVPVVRCRECQHYKSEEYFCPCVLPQGLECAKPDDFCSYGQRKEADHEVSE